MSRGKRPVPPMPELTVLVDRDEAIFAFPLPDGVEPLTSAESDVLLAIVTGRSNAAIARARGTSQRTVANQVASVLRKLGVASRTEVVAHLAELMARPRAPRG